MSIANYSELQSAITDYLARSDLASRVPDFIAMAESHFNRELRAREMVATSTVALSSGVSALPADFLEWISVQWIGTRTMDLKYSPPDSEEWQFRYRPNGDPMMFSIVGSNLQIRPAGTGNSKLAYYQQVPALATFTTNWLLTKCPDLYVYRSLAEAYIYQKDDTRAAEFITLADAETKRASDAADSTKQKADPPPVPGAP